MHRSLFVGPRLLSFFGAVVVPLVVITASAQAHDPLVDKAHHTLAQHTGTLEVAGLSQPVEVLRDRWGVPHLYARNTHDLFFAQGFVAAQDHMWQMELWRRNGEGRLAEVLGPDYLERDQFARLLTFRGDWNAEMSKYHPDGPVIFAAFASGVNAAIRIAIQQGRVPVEFDLMGFVPEPVWTARTVLTRMPAWTISRNASTELSRALLIKSIGLEKAQGIAVTDPKKQFIPPPGLDLADINPHILDIARGADDVSWHFKPLGSTTATGLSPEASALAARTRQELFPSDSNLDKGSNNWVLGGAMTSTGMPLLANDPHREVANPALRNLVHLNAPGWNDIGMTEPGVPGIIGGHNDDVAWGLTILGVDQQDLYVEETDPNDSDRYRYKGQWLTMKSDREVITVKGSATPVNFNAKRTIHGPVVYEDLTRHRAYALKWVGSEAGGAGYLGSLNVMQAHNWDEFTHGVARSWYLPSHSLVYADTRGNIGYVGAALSPIRPNWDGLLPVPGKDGRYEWAGFLPLEKMPREINGKRGFYNTSNNDVVPNFFPGYPYSLGYEYSTPFRFNRVTEFLSQPRKFTMVDMEALQSDHVSLPARQLVPLLKGLKGRTPQAQAALDCLAQWNDDLAQSSIAATLYEYWYLHLAPMVYAVHLPVKLRAGFHQYDPRRVLEWTRSPDASFGPDPDEARDRMLLDALDQALVFLTQHFGPDQSQWTWGSIHSARFEHPLLDPSTRALLAVPSVSRGGDAFTVQATSSATLKDANQTQGASVMFVLDAGSWDRSMALNAPGNESQAGSPHAADLAPLWGASHYFPLSFSRAKVEEATTERLLMTPAP